MTRYPQVMVNVKVTTDGKLQFYTDLKIKKAIEDAKKQLGSTGRVLVRVSGTEPLVRVMVEGEDYHQIEKLAPQIADVVKERLS